MAISNCTEYRKELARLSEAAIADSKPISVALASCYRDLDLHYADKDVRFRADQITKVPEPSDGFTLDEQDLRRQAQDCADKAFADFKALDATYRELFSKLGQEAFEKRISVVALAIYSTDQSDAAANWMSAHGDSVGIEVHDIEELRTELETDRCAGYLALFAQFDNGAIGVQVGEEDLAQFVSSISISETKMKASDYVYVDGPLEGDPPAAALEDLKELLGAGQLILGWTGQPVQPGDQESVCDLLTGNHPFSSEELHGAEEKTVSVTGRYESADRLGVSYCERSLMRLNEDPCEIYKSHPHKNFKYKHTTEIEVEVTSKVSEESQAQLKGSVKVAVTADFGVKALADIDAQLEAAVEAQLGYKKLSEDSLRATYKETFEEDVELPIEHLDEGIVGYRIEVDCGFLTIVTWKGEITVRQKWRHDPVGQICEILEEWELVKVDYLNVDTSVDLEHLLDENGQPRKIKVKSDQPCP